MYGEYDYYTVAEGGDDDYKDKPLFKQSCLNWNELRNYIGQDIKQFYGWHISNLIIYDEPKELVDFKVSCGLFKKRICGLRTLCGEEKGVCDGTKKITRPPQSWCYVEEVQTE